MIKSNKKKTFIGKALQKFSTYFTRLTTFFDKLQQEHNSLDQPSKNYKNSNISHRNKRVSKKTTSVDHSKDSSLYDFIANASKEFYDKIIESFTSDQNTKKSIQYFEIRNVSINRFIKGKELFHDDKESGQHHPRKQYYDLLLSGKKTILDIKSEKTLKSLVCGTAMLYFINKNISNITSRELQSTLLSQKLDFITFDSGDRPFFQCDIAFSYSFLKNSNRNILKKLTFVEDNKAYNKLFVEEINDSIKELKKVNKETQEVPLKLDEVAVEAQATERTRL